MNDIRRMQEILLKKFPIAKINLDAPLVKGGVWALDVFLSGNHLAVAWQSTKGFGIAWKEPHVYGQGADEVFEDLEPAYLRITQILTGWIEEQKEGAL